MATKTTTTATTLETSKADVAKAASLKADLRISDTGNAGPPKSDVKTSHTLKANPSKTDMMVSDAPKAGALPKADLEVPDVAKSAAPDQPVVSVQTFPQTNSNSASIQRFVKCQHGFVSGGQSFTSGEHGFVTCRCGFLSDHSGFLPDHSAFPPGQSGFVPDQSGFLPGQSGFLPGQSGFLPGHSGFTTGPVDLVKPVAKPQLCLTTRLTNLLKMIFLRTPDKFLIHLNKLFNSAEDLTAVISTIYYVLRVLGYYRAPKPVSNLEKMPQFTDVITNDNKDGFAPNPDLGKIPNMTVFNKGGFTDETILPTTPVPKSNWIGGSGSLLWNTRMTLRLFRLLPIYARARQLWSGPKPEEDSVLYATSILQCGLYGVSQLLENAAFLTECRIAPVGFTDALTKVRKGRSKALYTLAYRMWFLAATCEGLRMIRKVHLMWNHAAEGNCAEKDGIVKASAVEQPAKHHPWWHLEFLLPLAWFPVGWQVSGWVEHGSPGFNTALHTAACVLGDIHQTGNLWKSTDKVMIAAAA